ncbi:Tar ligand binding domain-containing protein [Burkholderia sp. FXe9]|nr:Tar ligand binding domain-containing protein [Burkholderia sp. FXe9]
MNLNALFSRFSIRTRIFSTLGLVAVLLVVSGLIGLAGMQSSNRALDEAYTQQLAAKTALSAASLNLTIVRTTLDRAMLHPEAPEVPDLVKKAESYLAKADTAGAATRRCRTTATKARSRAASTPRARR